MPSCLQSGHTAESHHHMMTVEIESWELSVKAVNESHSLGHVNGKLDSSGCVHHKSAKVMDVNTVSAHQMVTDPVPWCRTLWRLPTGMYWLITTRLGGELQQPITGSTLGWEKILSLGYSSLKSRDILGVHSLSARILAAISLPCHFPRQVSPLGLKYKRNVRN